MSQDITRLSTHLPSCSLTHTSLTPSPISVAYWYRKSTSVIESSISMYIYTLQPLRIGSSLFYFRKSISWFCSINPSISFLRLGCCLCPIRWGWHWAILGNCWQISDQESWWASIVKYAVSLDPENTDFIKIPWRALIFSYTVQSLI